MADSFAHLHLHTEYSMLDGAARLKDLFAEVQRQGMPAVAMTDHGNVFGAFDFYQQALTHDVKPILGVEAYKTPGTHRGDKTKVRWAEGGEADVSGGGLYTHMTLLAESATGLRNLFALASRASIEGQVRVASQYAARVDEELLAEYAQGLIATTGCLGGEVHTWLKIGDFDKACESAGRLIEIFGRDNVFLEIMDHGIDVERAVRGDLLRLGRKLKLRPLATNDAHYVYASQAKAHDALLCQPPGTLVRRVVPQSTVGTSRGAGSSILTEEVPIEKIAAGDRVVSWNGKRRRGAIRRSGSLVTEVARRDYSGEIIKVRTPSGASSKYTYDHKCVVRLDCQLDDGNYVVYLMRKGDWYRVGVTQYRRKGRGCDLGPMYRLKEECGDDIWVLSVHETMDEAREQEAWVGYRYNIPTWTFTRPEMRSGGRKAFYSNLWDRVGDISDRAKACLADFDRDIRFPFLTRGSLFVVKPQVVHACNLLSGMLVCEPAADTSKTYHGTGVWQPIQVFRETYSGPVYSMNVEEDHTYIADGIVTHNCVQTSKTISEEKRFKFHGEGYHLKTAQEMRALWDGEVPGACDNTLLVAERVQSYDEVFAPRDLMPRFPVPEGHTEESWLRHEVDEGLARRYPGGVPADRRRQADYELGVIAKMGFPSYFLVVQDYIRWAKEQGITVGPGRGSAAGSLVAYALGITDLDPIVHGLSFERFLNPERVTMPDVDVDFSVRGREQVIRYVEQRWGADQVARIGTYGGMKAKQAIKDAARVLGMEYGLGDEMCRKMPPDVMGKSAPLAAITDTSHPRYGEAEDLRKLLDDRPAAGQVLTLARDFEGQRRNWGVHAAGVVVLGEPLLDVLPVHRHPKTGELITQWDMGACEAINALKMDFLGLRNLDIVEDALANIRANRGEDVTLSADDLDDAATFDLIASGHTLGVFQLDGGPMRALLRAMRPTSFGDVSAAIALYRPGPMGANAHMDYADRKNGRKPVKPLHPELEEPLAPILAETYGVIVYQEQVTEIAKTVAGYSTARADLLRRAMGKKKKEVLDAEFVGFSEGMRARGYSQDAVTTLWDILVPFADYAFNKSHSAAYGVISYWTAYLKTHYPAEYMAALLSSVTKDADKRALYLAECRRMGIRVLPPDVNASQRDFAAVGADIRFGLLSVKDVGGGVVEAILRGRADRGEVTSFADWLTKTDPAALQKKAVAALIRAGAFDSLGHSRRGLMEVHADAVDAASRSRKQEAAGQGALLDLFATGDTAGAVTVQVPRYEWPKQTRLSLEREALGLYVSDHPLADMAHLLAEHGRDAIPELLAAAGGGEDEQEPVDVERPKAYVDGQLVQIAGIITAFERKTSRRGKPFAVMTLEDRDGAAITVLLFERALDALGPAVARLAADVVVAVRGRLKVDEEQAKVFGNDVKVLESGDAARAAARRVVLKVPAEAFTRESAAKLAELADVYPGESPVLLRMWCADERKESVLLLPFRLRNDLHLLREVTAIFGPNTLSA